MEVELVPRINKVTSLTSSITNQFKWKKQAEETNCISGKFYNGDRLAWLIDGSTLIVIHTSNGSIYSVYNFGRGSSHDLFITGVTEFIDDTQKWKLLVVTTDGAKGSFLNVFNIRQSKVDKVIYINEKVTSLEVVSNAGGVNRSNVLLGQVLRFFHGIVAIGTESGHVMTLDLGLDDESELIYRGNNLNLFHSSIKISFITGRLNDIPQKREDLTSENKLMAFSLNSSVLKDKFYYLSPENNVLLDFPLADVYVSSMLYVQHMGCLLIGYNFGGFQIYDMTKLKLVFTCDPDDIIDLPVIQFVFQEPENDPKKFCYVWVIRGQSDNTDTAENQFCHSSLYSVLFYSKTLIEGIGTCYLGVRECSKRFEFEFKNFTKTNDTKFISSRLIFCTSVDSRSLKTEATTREANFPIGDEANGGLCCCIFAWECYPLDKNKGSKINLGIFDLNQWYQAQMPPSLSILRIELCPYFGLFSMDAIGDLVSSYSILDVNVNTQSITRPTINNRSEAYFYPASLSFDLTALTDTCIVHTTYLGLQRQVLQKLRQNASALLVDPRHILDLSLYSSLITQPTGTIISQMSLATKRETIFSMALENGALDIIMSCINGWAAGRYASEGCTLRFIQDWAWKKVLKIKNMLDKHCAILYDYSGLHLDATFCQSLRQHIVMLKDLEVIFKSLSKQTHIIPTTNLGAKELDNRASVISLLILHFDAVEWFIGARLLPEVYETEENDSLGFPYPKSFLTRIYNNRRLEIQNINSTLNPNDLLIIDGIVEDSEESLVNLWKNQTGNAAYPPNTLNALLNIYLLPELNSSLKHMIVQYFLLDMAELLQNGTHAHLAEPLAEYASSFSCTQSIILLTKGFWLLDHKDYEGAINVLLHPLINPLDIRPWQSRRIMKAFLYQGEQEKALRFAHIYQPCRESAEDCRFYLTLLLANGLISDAFSYLRCVRDQANSEELIQHFFLGCQQTQNIRGMLQLIYSPVEEQSLIKFLTNNPDPKTRELLLIYYLQHSHFVEALQINEQMNSNLMVADSSAKERAATRNAIIEGYSKVYPNIQLELAKLTKSAASQRKTFWEKGHKSPSPLSTMVVSNPVEPVSKSSVLEAVMQKITEIWTQSAPERSFIDDSNKSMELNRPLTITPFTPRRNLSKVFHHSVCNPTIQKRDVSEVPFGDSFLTSSPTKSKFLDVSPFHLSESSKRKTSSKVFSSELRSLLQPVPVKRKVSNQKSLSSPNSACSSPISILKQRTLTTVKGSVSIDRSDDYPDLVTDVPVTPKSTLQFITEEPRLSKIKFSAQKNANSDSSITTTPSPRRPLHNFDESPKDIIYDSQNESDEDEDDGKSDETDETPIRPTPMKVQDEDEELSIYETPDRNDSASDNSEISSVKSKAFFSPTGFMERMNWLKSEFAKESVKRGEEITVTSIVTSSFTTDKTELTVTDKPSEKSLVEVTVDSCFANTDEEDKLMKKFENRKKKGLQQQTVVTEADNVFEEGAESSPTTSCASTTTDSKPAESSPTPSLPSTHEELSINVDYLGITKASLRSYSPKASPNLSVGSRSDRESVASELTEPTESEAGDESTVRKTRGRKRTSAKKTFAFSPPTVVEDDVTELTTDIAPLSPASAAFIFSTPSTRSRPKKPRKGSGSSSKTGETLTDSSKSSAVTVTQTRRRRSSRSSEGSSDALISFSSPALEPVAEEQSPAPTPRHSMVLRRPNLKSKRITKLR